MFPECGGMSPPHSQTLTFLRQLLPEAAASSAGFLVQGGANWVTEGGGSEIT